jgi:hypothetical protein
MLRFWQLLEAAVVATHGITLVQVAVQVAK